MKKVITPLALAACFLLVSCGSSPTPLASKPPVKSLKVQGFTYGDGFVIKKFSFPTAVYTPIMEDEDSYYYSPPGGQIPVSDTGMKYSQTGGIYMDREATTASGMYLKAPIGRYAKIEKKDIKATLEASR